MLSMVVATPAYAPALAPTGAVTRAATPNMGFGKAELEGAPSTRPNQQFPRIMRPLRIMPILNPPSALRARSARQEPEPRAGLLGPDWPRRH